eukprot:TRINITY_DN75380_c0_g1_i1.p1 TRINITY_DN75380_c0_g1~~TRINITY_DN75380_c0_g1_i1.p1  ORF type:complete len:798 (+),score=125.48 TRINITY_DN75380_c0_g1_i1:70-2463(+)
MFGTAFAGVESDTCKTTTDVDTTVGNHRPRIIGLFVALSWLWFNPEALTENTDLDIFSETALPSKILHVRDTESDARTLGRSLRGCCGEPVEFRWAYADHGFVVGERLQTRILALDFAGRPASAFACNALRFNLTLSGHARLTKPFQELQWEGGELHVEIENTVAESVSAELRIESRDAAADVLLYTAEFRFVPGPLEEFELDVRPLGSPRSLLPSDKIGNRMIALASPTTLDIVLIAHDRFGNRALHTAQSEIARTTLRTSTSSLRIQSFFEVDQRGEPRARVQSVHSGPAELWLEMVDGSRCRGIPLRDHTVVRFNFTGPPNVKPTPAHMANLSAKDVKWAPLAEEVRSEFAHAWRSYRKHAWGSDELMPLSKRGKDTFGDVGMTILDSLTTLWLMGLSDDFDDASKWVEEKLDFGKANREVSVFELVIRAVGGLLGAHALSGKTLFLEHAQGLADRLLPAFNTSSGMPLPRWDVSKRRGKQTGEATILAEAGSVQLEFRSLTGLTGDIRYRDAADRSFNAIRSTGLTGMIPVKLTPPEITPTRALSENLAVGALADSYYEYVLKQWLQSPGEIQFKEMWVKHMEALPSLVRGDTGENMTGPLRIVEIDTDGRTIWKMDHLSCFAPGMIALALQSLPDEDLTKRRKASWLRLAEGMTEGCAEMWTKSATGIAPEFVLIDGNAPFRMRGSKHGAHSFLRPETAESLFYMFRLTGNEKYRKIGKKMLKALVKNAKVDGGYATVNDVRVLPTQKKDEMQSFVLAETFKYLYLLFSPSTALDLDKFVLNTEGHPLRKLW